MNIIKRKENQVFSYEINIKSRRNYHLVVALVKLKINNNFLDIIYFKAKTEISFILNIFRLKKKTNIRKKQV